MEILETTTEAHLCTPSGHLPLKAYLGFADSDPVEMTLTLVVRPPFATGRQATDMTTWTFARELFDAAFSDPGVTAGVGDVKVTFLPAIEQVRVELLDMENAHHPVYLPALPCVRFMAASLRLVPADQEFVDVDEALAHLLDGGA